MHVLRRLTWLGDRAGLWMTAPRRAHRDPGFGVAVAGDFAILGAEGEVRRGLP